ncbi:MAG TPA: DUF4349 domain-containing protein [Solirubrobacteraceae bacterium]|jgi:hypothetical protein|nr:DUF4349 domain-containing protein [Solirubrobacteraceae bacterium]
MRIIAFPGGEDAPAPDAWLAELDAALIGHAEGPEADAWRELRGEVRSLAPPMSPELERRLERRLAVEPDASHAPDAHGVPRAPVAPTRRLARLRDLRRPQLAGAGALAAVLVVALAVLIPGLGGSGPKNRVVPPVTTFRSPATSAPAFAPSSTFSGQAKAENGTLQAAPKSAGAASSAGKAEGPSPAVASPENAASSPAGAAPGRVQQLAASVSLSAGNADVQAIADGVSRAAVREEGFVEQSHVQVQRHGTSEAGLNLKIPSAHLAAALAAIGRLAPVSAESQSLQDITDSYDAAKRRLADAVAERRALLRALARASTEGQIDSLRERLAQARGAIVQDGAALRAVSQRASTAEVEVTVLGGASSSSTAGEGLTLHRGLHDALRVLTVALIVLLIAAAVLVPLALLIAAAVGSHRLWRRHARERALDATTNN